jgi:ribose transport system ATP-binding protein
VATGRLAETDLRAIIGQMVGRDLDELFPRVPHAPGEPILELAEFQAQARSRPANLVVRRGEVLGLAGLVGAGRSRLVRAIFGLEPVVAGRVRVAQVVGGQASPGHRIAQGVGFLSEDRKSEGLALGRSIEDNMTYPGLPRHARYGWLRLQERRDAVAGWMARLRIAASGPVQPAGSLSGGNQQKVALARLLHQEADVLILDEPTRGIDVGSKAEIYRLLGELAAQGKAILVVSSYLPELFGICDRIAVMSRGSLSAALPVDQWTEHQVMEVACGG